MLWNMKKKLVEDSGLVERDNERDRGEDKGDSCFGEKEGRMRKWKIESFLLEC